MWQIQINSWIFEHVPSHVRRCGPAQSLLKYPIPRSLTYRDKPGSIAMFPFETTFLEKMQKFSLVYILTRKHLGEFPWQTWCHDLAHLSFALVHNCVSMFFRRETLEERGKTKGWTFPACCAFVCPQSVFFCVLSESMSVCPIPILNVFQCICPRKHG